MQDTAEANWNLHKGLDLEQCMTNLPANLQTDLQLYLQSRAVSMAYIFADASAALVRRIVPYLKTHVFLAEELVAQKGDVAGRVGVG